jgi:hypothetical protein
VAVLAVVAGVQAFWDFTAVADYGWFRYGPLDAMRDELRQINERALNHRRWVALGTLLSVGCLAAAALALPGYRRRWLPVAVGGAAVLLMAAALWEVWDALAQVWLPLLAALVALTAAVAAARRSGGRWTSVGLLLLMLAALDVAYGIDGLIEVRELYSDRRDSDYSVAVAIGVSTFDLWATLISATLVAGPALVAIGCLRARRPEVVRP